MSREATGWSKAAVKKALQIAARDLGRPPTGEEFDRRPGPSCTAVGRLFGSYNEGLLAAGLPVNRVSKQDVDVPEDISGVAQRGAYIKGYRSRMRGEERDSHTYYVNHGGVIDHWHRGWDDADEEMEL